MNKGFIFNHNKCVACGACNAACILENGWTVHPREIYTYNKDVSVSLPLINLSLACNHCEKPVCLECCPTGTYFREPQTGAIVIDDKKCIGCKYCQWNCPYDAPKFDAKKRIIGKCNLCYSGLLDGRLPACTDACPTGALSYGELPGIDTENKFPWFPDKDLNPSLEFSGEHNTVIIPLKIIPENMYVNQMPVKSEKPSTETREWSLVAFSFLATLSVSSVISSLINGVFPNFIFIVLINILTGLVSLFHLGRKLRAWRALSNLKSSPLSREIALFLIYGAVSILAVITELPAVLVVASIVGLLLLIVIDSVYINSDKRKSVIFHSGQTFLSSLLIASFFSGAVIPFIFIALIKVVSSIHKIYFTKGTGNNFGLRYFRLAILVVMGIRIISAGYSFDPVIIALFLAGELIDRIIFYSDFEPMNLNTFIYKHIKTVKDEKKRG